MSSTSTILIAEDSLDDTLLIKRGLANVKFPLAVQFVEDGTLAIDYFMGKDKYGDRKKFPLPSVLLTDLKMPRVNGFELLLWVRSKEEFENLPVIVITGSNETRDRQRAIELGADAYLTKELLIRPPASLIEAILRHAGAPMEAGSKLSPQLAARESV